jgi:hypothetical protein
MRVSSATRGVVYAEFLLAFAPFFTLFVSGVQLSIIAAARLVVQHAAWQAVRAAVVTIDDDPFFYDDGLRKHLEGKGGGQQGASHRTAVHWLSSGLDHEPAGLGARGTERLNHVRNAAYWPLGVLSPSAVQVARWLPMVGALNSEQSDRSLASDLGEPPALRVLTGVGVYGRVGAAITFPTAPRSSASKSSRDAVFTDDEAVTVRVTYLLPCNVPLAREILCEDLVGMTGIPDAVRSAAEAVREPGVESFTRVIASWRRDFPRDWKNFERNMKELLRAEWSALQLGLYLQTDERFVVLRGEATLPNHGAAYKYHSQLEREAAAARQP